MVLMAEAAFLKEIQKFIWSQGAFELLEREAMLAAVTVVEACGVRSGDCLLDVGAGTGNAAIAAARRGARVVASDLTPTMIEIGSARTADEGMSVEWIEADAEALPFATDRFDRVLSCFGAMFAPRPDAVVRELFRVTRAGGTVGLASWTPAGFIGRLMETVASYMPAPPNGVPGATQWGVGEVVRSRFDGFATDVRVERRSVVMEHPSAQAMWELHARCNGPMVAASMALGERFSELAVEIQALISEFNQGIDGNCRVESEYLLAVATKPNEERSE